jgi:adenylate kinase family enzyme
MRPAARSWTASHARAPRRRRSISPSSSGARPWKPPSSSTFPLDELLRRLSGRWLCEGAGHTYHETAYPPRVPGICDICGSRLIQRDDDRPDVVRARLEKQLGALDDVVGHYRAAGLLRTVDGRRPIAAVTSDLLDCIEPIAPGRAQP